MIQSMTGFGKAEKQFDNKNISVELRSLNSKSLDLNTRLPYHLKAVSYTHLTLPTKRIV